MNKILFTFIFGTVDYLSPPLYCTEIVLNSTVQHSVQSQFSDIKFSDNLWFSDYFTKTIFQFTA